VAIITIRALTQKDLSYRNCNNCTGHAQFRDHAPITQREGKLVKYEDRMIEKIRQSIDLALYSPTLETILPTVAFVLIFVMFDISGRIQTGVSNPTLHRVFALSKLIIVYYQYKSASRIRKHRAEEYVGST
jgi:hypothetical protein